MLRAVSHPEIIPVAPLLLLLHLRGVRVVLLHAAASVLLTVLGVRGLYSRARLMVLLKRRRRGRTGMGVLLQLGFKASNQPGLWVQNTFKNNIFPFI